MDYLTPIDLLSNMDKREIRDCARYMALRGRPRSPEAETLRNHIMENIILPAQGGDTAIRPSSSAKLYHALGAMLADLLASAAAGRWSQRSLGHHHFTNGPVGRTAFRTVLEALTASGHLVMLKGYRQPKEGFQPERLVASCYRPTVLLLDMAVALGVVLSNIHRHFSTGHRAAKDAVCCHEAISKRTTMKKEDGKGRKRGKDLEILSTDADARAIRERVDRHNAFLLAEGRVAGFAFGGLRRVFSNADLPGFCWRTGGRFYSMQGWDAYERWKGRSAARAERIRIDGEEVVEVDISAAHLTILYGLLGRPFYPSADPYAVPGFDRETVKEWLKKALGKATLNADGRKANRVREATIAHHPILEQLEGCGIAAVDLQYHESEIMFMAIERLRDDHDVLCLPVHDSLIAPRSKVGLVKDVLSQAFQSYFGEVLMVNTDIRPRLA